jgi:hypothetical protein
MAITEQDTRKSVAEHEVTKVHGQPTIKDIDFWTMNSRRLPRPSRRNWEEECTATQD